MSNTARNIVSLDEYRGIGTKHNNPKTIYNRTIFEQSISSKYSDFEKSGGGGNMDNYITRPEFEQHQRHLDSRFDGISKDIEIAKREIKDEIKDEKVTSRKFWIGISVPTIISLITLVVSILF